VQNVSDGCFSPFSSQRPGEAWVRSAAEFVILEHDNLRFLIHARKCRQLVNSLSPATGSSATQGAASGRIPRGDSGTLGEIIVTPIMDALGVTDYAARGFAVGLASRGIGTSRAFAVDPVAGVFAGLAVGLNAIVTPAVIPALLPWLIR
jgi:hypothetical protein